MCQDLHPGRWPHCQGIEEQDLPWSPTLLTRGLPCARDRQGDTIIGSGTSPQKMPLGNTSEASRPHPPSPELPGQVTPAAAAHRPHWKLGFPLTGCCAVWGLWKPSLFSSAEPHPQNRRHSALEQVPCFDIQPFPWCCILGLC